MLETLISHTGDGRAMSDTRHDQYGDRLDAGRHQQRAGRDGAQTGTSSLRAGRSRNHPTTRSGRARQSGCRAPSTGSRPYEKSAQRRGLVAEHRERSAGEHQRSSPSGYGNWSCRPPTESTTSRILKTSPTRSQQITETVKQDANTQYAGQYVFSGTLTNTAPYEQGEANDAFQGNEGTIAACRRAGRDGQHQRRALLGAG